MSSCNTGLILGLQINKHNKDKFNGLNFNIPHTGDTKSVDMCK